MYVYACSRMMVMWMCSSIVFVLHEWGNTFVDSHFTMDGEQMVKEDHH